MGWAFQKPMQVAFNYARPRKTRCAGWKREFISAPHANVIRLFIGIRYYPRSLIRLLASEISAGDMVSSTRPRFLRARLRAFAAAFVPTAKPWGALRIMLRDSKYHRSFNAGWPEGAMAGALGLKLSGPRQYPGTTVNDPWIGDGVADATAKDISRALYLYFVACLINGVWVAAIAMVRFSL